MIKRFFLIAALICGLISPAGAGSVLLLGAGGGGGGGGGVCSQATTFLARTSGLSGTETTAYQTMICGMVTDGTWPLLDALYIFATNTTTTANLNLINTSFTITPQNSPTFTADAGYTGNGTSSWLNTNLAGAQTNYNLNSGSIGIAIPTNDTSSVSTIDMGAIDVSINSVFLAANFTLKYAYGLNDGGTVTGTASATSRGLWAVSRTSSGSVSFYQNGSSTAVSTTSVASTSVPTSGVPMGILARAQSPTTAQTFSARQVSAAWVGAGLTGAQFASISARINAYLAALGVNVY
jgi:hypothetical protein